MCHTHFPSACGLSTNLGYSQDPIPNINIP